MALIQKQLLVPYPPEPLFEVVTEVTRYPEFLEYCSQGLLKPGEQENEVLATLELKISGVAYAFTTRNLLSPPHRIDLTFHQGPFRFLKGYWLFKPVTRDSTQITLEVEFAFNTPFLNMAATPFLIRGADRLLELFQQRVHHLYPSS